MDPNACWKEMSECNNGPNPSDDQIERRNELARSLLKWVLGGGFLPTITGNAEFDHLVVVSTCKAIKNLSKVTA